MEQVTEADTVFDGFFEQCVANPNECDLAQDGISAEDLSQKIYLLLDNLKFNPINLGSNLNDGLIGCDGVKNFIGQNLYNPPTEWPTMATLLHILLTNNVTALTEIFTSPSTQAPTISPKGPEALQGIQCSETTLRSDNLTSVAPLVGPYVARSRIFGESIAALVPLTCARWLFKAKEVYAGDFQAQTRQPLLLIGGPFDPITPLISAQNASSGFAGSIVLQHDGYGVSDMLPPKANPSRAIMIPS